MNVTVWQCEMCGTVLREGALRAMNPSLNTIDVYMDGRLPDAVGVIPASHDPTRGYWQDVFCLKCGESRNYLKKTKPMEELNVTETEMSFEDIEKDTGNMVFPPKQGEAWAEFREIEKVCRYDAGPEENAARWNYKRLEKDVEDPKKTLTIDEGYHTRVYFTGGVKFMPVGNYSLKIELFNALRKHGAAKGAKIRIGHPDRGKYVVEVI